MSTVFVSEVPPQVESYLSERRRLGLDGLDEMWQGVLHVSPGPPMRHALVDEALRVVLRPHAEAAGLTCISNFNLGSSGDYRVPDHAYVRSPDRDAFYVATAAIVAEIVSPGDESFAKISFYEEHGVEEILLIDPANRTVTIRSHGRDAHSSDLLNVSDKDLVEAIAWP